MRTITAALAVLAATAAVLLPAGQASATARLDTNCVSIAKHDDGLTFDYTWGTRTSCHGGAVYRLKSNAAVHNIGFQAYACGHGFYLRHGKTLFIAKRRATVKQFKHSYKARYHSSFGKVRSLNGIC